MIQDLKIACFLIEVWPIVVNYFLKILSTPNVTLQANVNIEKRTEARIDNLLEMPPSPIFGPTADSAKRV